MPTSKNQAPDQKRKRRMIMLPPLIFPKKVAISTNGKMNSMMATKHMNAYVVYRIRKGQTMNIMKDSKRF